MNAELSRTGRVWAYFSDRARLLKVVAGAGFLAASLGCGIQSAAAQAIVAVVNGTPVTNIDVEQRMKLLRVLRKPAGHDAALQSVIDDDLKLDETNKYKIRAGDGEIGQEISQTASRLKMSAEALLAAMRGAGISENHIKDHFASEFCFHTLMHAYYKGVEVSESQIRAELAKEGGKAAAGTEYVLHQVIFAVPSTAKLDQVNGRMHEAEQLRTRFADCNTGLPLARGMDNVAVKEEIRRNAAQLGEGLRQLLDKTPTGHLTPPQRAPEGIQMVAVCSKSASNDDSAARAAISERLMASEIDAEAEKKLVELRQRAVIVKK